MGKTATHALCPCCSSFQPVIWKEIKRIAVWPDGQSREFEGLIMECRTCKFEITQVGFLQAAKQIG